LKVIERWRLHVCTDAEVLIKYSFAQGFADRGSHNTAHAGLASTQHSPKGRRGG